MLKVDPMAVTAEQVDLLYYAGMLSFGPYYTSSLNDTFTVKTVPQVRKNTKPVKAAKIKL